MTSQVGYDSLANKVAVVTGGASGIGAAIVDAYAVKGATVVVLDKDVDSAQRKVSQGSAAATFTCDVTSEQSVAAAISTVNAQFGRIDVLVNSAGLAALGPAELTVDCSPAVNLRGSFWSVSKWVGSCSPKAAARDQLGLPGRDDRTARTPCLLRVQGRPGRPHQGVGPGMGWTWSHG